MYSEAWKGTRIKKRKKRKQGDQIGINFAIGAIFCKFNRPILGEFERFFNRKN
jgi:hypothetical protein